MKISILILTLNEESNIKACIESVGWSDDVVVLDSFSDDETQIIAEGLGARVIKRKFDNWSSHQNWAVNNIKFKNKWVLYVDADERCDTQLKDETRDLNEESTLECAFRFRRKDYFMGRWLKRAQLYPSWFVRFFRPDKIRYERLVNPVAIVDGDIGELEGHLIHYPFSHGVTHWINRHNNYSDTEAKEALSVHKERNIQWGECLSSDPNVRRRCLKDIFFVLPGRPLIKFIHYYFIRLGVLDGLPGFYYCVLQSFYEFMILIKTKELRYIEKENG